MRAPISFQVSRRLHRQEKEDSRRRSCLTRTQTAAGLCWPPLLELRLSILTFPQSNFTQVKLPASPAPNSPYSPADVPAWRSSSNGSPSFVMPDWSWKTRTTTHPLKQSHYSNDLLVYLPLYFHSLTNLQFTWTPPLSLMVTTIKTAKHFQSLCSNWKVFHKTSPLTTTGGDCYTSSTGTWCYWFSVPISTAATLDPVYMAKNVR